MIVIGVTGSLASGKSQAAQMFRSLGAKLFDADEAAKKSIQKGKPSYKAILKIFGREYLKPNGQIDRKKLAWHVFTHPKDLKKLNILIHPGVIFESLKMIESLRNKKGVLVMDVPLLFESKMENLADCTVVVTSSRQKMLARAKKKGLTKKLAEKILSTQWSLNRKERLADFVIHNDGSLVDLKREVSKIWDQIRAS